MGETMKKLETLDVIYSKGNPIGSGCKLKYIDQLSVNFTTRHRVISFKQKAWMAPYIEFNSEKRKTAKSDFEKDFFKLLNNSVREDCGQSQEPHGTQTNDR